MCEEIIYDTSTKKDCWYKDVCTSNLCDESSFCIRHYKMTTLIEKSTLKGKQQHSSSLKPDKVDYDAFVRLKNIQKNIKDFVSNGNNILIYSDNCGNGKTSWSIKLLLSYFNEIWADTDLVCRGLFISVPKLVFAMKENISKPNDYFQYVNENIVNADLVVWDEINYKDWTSFEQEYFLSILSQRLSLGKSNIYTTNFSLQVVKEKLGPRLASRIVGSSELIEFKGTDKRALGVSHNE